MKHEEILRQIGLNAWEAQTYLALSELGSTTTGPLVKKCLVPQSKIYSVLESLHNKGLVNHVLKGKIKYFQAKNPNILLSILKDKERKVKEILPDLKKISSLSKRKQSVEIYEGMKSITHFVVDLIENSKEGEEWFSFSISEDQFSEKSKDFWYKVGYLRYLKKLKVRIMDNIKYKKDFQKAYPDRWHFIKKIIRFSGDVFPATTIIFQDKIILLNFLSEIETAVVITSKDLVKHYKAYYMQHWNKAKPPKD
ncbi:MAG: hypothetical protein JSW08_01420 [archaeon]|nr:MAG: hypothetical protein JSW08_01420 [archaeon]